MNRREFLGRSSAAAVVPMAAACSGSDTEIISDLPTSSFDDVPTAEEVTEGIDLTGKVAVVTGCNSGLGLETMRVLALRGAHVFGTGRTMERASEACSSVEGRATPLVLELSDLQSCVDCAAALSVQTPVIDMLICNAGIVAGNVKDEGIRAIEQHGLFEINGDQEMMELMDELLSSFVKQHRMKLPGKEYKPCYRIVK